MKVRELGRFIRDQRSSLSLSLRNVSGLTGVSIPYLSQIERGLRRPSADILNAIAKALRVSSETLYVKAGILDERGGATDPIGEILRDGEITDQQKRILIDLYQSFRGGDGAASKPQSRSAAAKTTRARPAPKRRVTARSVSKPGSSSGRAKPSKTSKTKPAKKKSTRPSARKAPAKKTAARKRRTRSRKR